MLLTLPTVNINIKANIYGFEEDGALLYEYKPLQNLKVTKSDGSIDLSDLRLSAYIANIDINKPIALDTEVSYDDSINLLINDRINPLKIVNSRFYLIDSSNYKIADRKGNVDTNIYTESDFKIETSLIKSVRSIVNLSFEGIDNGGRLPVGSYHYYFKLADADGNETDFISESGKVVCHIGAVNHPQSIRGGLLDENSDKLVKFKLSNLDLAYDYINIYYTRNTGDDLSEVTKAYKILDKFKINSATTNITITGYEGFEEIDPTEINIQYASFEATKTLANCQNITFAGNITKNYELFKTLEKYSLFVTPELVYTENIGNLSPTYYERYNDTGYEYFNTKNIYYKLGYWNEEIYRFGIVYVLNDFTLSPVFNIRGTKELTNGKGFHHFNLADDINYGEDFIIENAPEENAKGVFKIKSESSVFAGKNPITPIGIRFNFNSYVVTGGENGWLPGLKDVTKGFFIVRQKRIPTLLAQGLSIATSKKSYTPILKKGSKYFSESFLENVGNRPRLGRSIFDIEDSTIASENALLCPEATLKPYIFNNFFNSSEFVLRKANQSSTGTFADNADNTYSLGSISSLPIDSDSIYKKSNLLLVEPEIELINNGDQKFCSRAGNPIDASKHTDPIKGNLDSLTETQYDENAWSNSLTKIRGDFNTYVGTSSTGLSFGQYYNIFQKDYDFNNWKNYFRVRYNDSSPFMPIGDRISWDSILPTITTENIKSPSMYRGDCYINTYSHRVINNFIDPELPTNNTIVDPWTWYKNFRVKVTKIKNANGFIIDDTSDTYTNATTELSYKKVLDIFTYRTLFDDDDKNNLDTTSVQGLITPEARKYKKYSELNGSFGASKINRPDVNAVPIGHWATFKVCSSTNLSMRDVDFSRSEEEAVHKMKRSFYPLQSPNPSNKLPESKVINSGISKSLGDKYYFEIPDVPFIKTNFSNRIYYSDILQESSFKNGNRVFKAQNYQDYTREYGAIVKLIEWYGKIIVVLEHGIIMIPVNERAMVTNAQGENIYINTDTVLPKNPRVISNTYGSIWEDAIVKTPNFIYGLDTIGKKIWRTNGEKFELISDLKIQKFLNDNIKIKVSDQKIILGTHVIKAHYNAFKYDVMFVFVYNGVSWNLCWNELLGKWITRYTWFPEYSENINNIFYTFANKNLYPTKANTLFKHGFAGGLEESGNILPTYWYDTQNKFELEFIVNNTQGVQKIFDNLKIISNAAAPESFYYSIVGDGYDWKNQKDTILNINSGITTLDALDLAYKNYLLANTQVKKIPYIFNYNLDNSLVTKKDLKIYQDNKTKENFVQSYQKGLDIRSVGRLSGNMQYVEDFWDVQIQPISFKQAYLSSGNLALSDYTESRIRDKYIKIRIVYDGTKYAIVNALKTLFTLSYA